MTATLFRIETKLQEIMKFAIQPRGDWDFDDAILKGIEEQGELAEAILITCGRLPHKTLSEHPTGEIADNINQLIDVLSFNEEKYPLNVDIQSLEAHEIVSYAKEIICPAHKNPMNNAAVVTFKGYLNTKNAFNENPSHLLLNALVENLVILNCFIVAVHDKKEINDIDDTFFDNANCKLATELFKKHKKWKGIEKTTADKENS
jgi:NTP pyrophosphatase (non-canonical NTP hydrolase)